MMNNERQLVLIMADRSEAVTGNLLQYHSI